MPQDGSGPARQMTSGGDTYKFDLPWSPDSKRILWSDKKLRLQYVDVQTARRSRWWTQAKAWEIANIGWSPDSQWIAYAKPEERQMSKIYLFSLAAKRAWPVTEQWFDSGKPVFSADGKYLFFVSQRSYHPREKPSRGEPRTDMRTIFFITLAKDTKSLFDRRAMKSR